MDPIFIGASLGLGAGKHALDKKREKQDMLLRAEETRLSPWTRQTPQTQVRHADPVGTLMQFGMAGAGMSQSIANQDMANAINQAYLDRVRSGTARALPMPMQTMSPWTTPNYGFTPQGTPIYAPWGMGI